MDARSLGKLTAPLARKIQNMLTRGTVGLSNASTKMQTLQVTLLESDTPLPLEHFEPYGYTSRPKPGAEVVTGSFDGDRSHSVVIVAADRRYRLTTLEEGDVAIYTDEGAKIVLGRGRVIDVECDVYRVNTKQYIVNTDAYDVTAQAASIDADHASATCPFAAPDMVIGGVSHVNHHHQEHDGPPTGGPVA